MTLVNPETVTRAGVTGTYINAGSGADYYIRNDGRTILYVRNSTNAGSIKIFITKAVDGQLPPERTIPLAANEAKFIGYFNPDEYNITSGTNAGRIQVRMTMPGAAIWVIN